MFCGCGEKAVAANRCKKCIEIIVDISPAVKLNIIREHILRILLELVKENGKRHTNNYRATTDFE